MLKHCNLFPFFSSGFPRGQKWRPQTPNLIFLTQSGDGTTPIWCRGGSRNVERCWGFPYVKIEKLQHFYLMFFWKTWNSYPRMCKVYLTNLHHLPILIFTILDKQWHDKKCKQKRINKKRWIDLWTCSEKLSILTT